MFIPYQQLDSDTLQSVLDSIITREGTDYGEQERTLEEKREQILRQLKAGDVVLVFDEMDQSVNLMSAQDFTSLPA